MSNLVFVRTDKNGTQIFHDCTCRRCGGAGASDKWCFTGRVCWECGGSGVTPHHPQIVKKYTPEYEAKLEAKRIARQEKERAELRAKAEKLNEEFMAEYFPEGKCYVLAMSTEDAWKVMDELKSLGLKNSNAVGWFFTEKQERFPVVEISPLEVTFLSRDGIRMFSNEAWKVIDAKVEALKPVSQYVGTVGEKITVTAKYDHTAYYDTQFGTTYIHNFVTLDGNLLVWKTGSVGNLAIDENSIVEISASVKDHSEYHGKKQTALIRCKINLKG